MTLSKLAASSVDLSAAGPVAIAAVSAAPEAPDLLEAVVAASSARSARLSTSMTQLLLEAQSTAAPNDPAAVSVLFRAKR
ncbi:hypothetical protein [uncultured Sphingomonas sp.]|uniref:hypothetical protein n=1 Tax=uncultured Sphingomonas sp. TaxID=158754 RepID=UPI0025CE1E7B|nr:hypothetical protein [uncultured Sphingomonas sp.]